MAYAWSRFKKEVNEWGRVTKWIEPGEKISKSDLGLSDDEWNSLKESGAVRDDPYPDVSRQTSPAEHFRANPDEAPSVNVDESTPSDEAMGEIEAGLASNQKLPGSEDAQQQQENQQQQQENQQQQKQPWQK